MHEELWGQAFTTRSFRAYVLTPGLETIPGEVGGAGREKQAPGGGGSHKHTASITGCLLLGQRSARVIQATVSGLMTLQWHQRSSGS